MLRKLASQTTLSMLLLQPWCWRLLFIQMLRKKSIAYFPSSLIMQWIAPKEPDSKSRCCSLKDQLLSTNIQPASSSCSTGLLTFLLQIHNPPLLLIELLLSSLVSLLLLAKFCVLSLSKLQWQAILFSFGNSVCAIAVNRYKSIVFQWQKGTQIKSLIYDV